MTVVVVVETTAARRVVAECSRSGTVQSPFFCGALGGLDCAFVAGCVG